MCCPLVFEFSVGIGGFVIGLGKISFFFSQCLTSLCNLVLRHFVIGLCDKNLIFLIISVAYTCTRSACRSMISIRTSRLTTMTGMFTEGSTFAITCHCTIFAKCTIVAFCNKWHIHFLV